ncbi:tRNA dimethylallyltransferase [Dictyocoela muelleri]|nr:tRNA dimethylallyltransferase [Dictyocoela muelleri]
MKKYPIFISGPTGIGKTELGLKLSSYLNLPLISCDSIQVYKGLDIGSNKYKPNTFCIDVVSPFSKFDVEDFIDYCKKYDEKSIYVGGSSFYMERIGDGLKIFLYIDRISLYKKLDLRCEEMIKQGFFKEVLNLKKQGLNTSLPAGRSIGYREALDFLNSDIDEQNFYTFLEKFKTRTRNLVRRQEIYIRNKNYLWIDVSRYDPFNEIINIINMDDDEFNDINKLKKYEPPKCNNHKILRKYRSVNIIFNDKNKIEDLIRDIKNDL